jgi:hypothetical protein
MVVDQDTMILFHSVFGLAVGIKQYSIRKSV